MRLIWGATALAGMLALAQRPAVTNVHEQTSQLIQRAYVAGYNLDYDEGLKLAHQALSLEPEASRTHRTIASVLWMQMLFLRGAYTIDQFMGSAVKSEKSWPKLPVDVETEFQVELTRSLDLADARLKALPNDLDAKHDVGAASALQASYLASVKGNMMSALPAAKRAFQTEEDVYERDSSRSSAALVVGIYRYVVSTFSLPTRMFAYVAGFGGGKEKGISLLEIAAAGQESHVEATAALMLIYTKEGRHAEVVNLARKLKTEFPKNRLFLLEEGAASCRAGQGADANTVLTEGLARYERDPRPKMPGEKALWLYKRGIARTQMGRLPDALADLTMALENKPAGWVLGRVHLQLGRIADLGGDRKRAVVEYRQAKSICDAENDPIAAAEAERLIKQPYTGK